MIADRIGRGLAWLCAASTLVPLVAGLAVLGDLPADRVVVEAWRTFGFAVFAGLWTLVALRPRRSPGIWELLLLHKGAVTVFALTVLDAPEGVRTAVVDATLVVATAAAYVLCRGWRSWQRVS